MDGREEYAAIPAAPDNECFGCGDANEAGLQMKFFETPDKDAVCSWLTVAAHMCGYKTMVHGGIVAAILDEIMSKAAGHLLDKRVITKSMSVEYLRPVMACREICAEARLVETDTDKSRATVEGAIFDGDNVIRAKSIGVFAIVTPALMERLKKGAE